MGQRKVLKLSESHKTSIWIEILEIHSVIHLRIGGKMVNPAEQRPLQPVM